MLRPVAIGRSPRHCYTPVRMSILSTLSGTSGSGLRACIGLQEACRPRHRPPAARPIWRDLEVVSLDLPWLDLVARVGEGVSSGPGAL